MENEHESQPKDEKKILYNSFNQDYKCFLIGSKKGCTIYQSEPFKKGFELSKKNYNSMFLLYRNKRRIFNGFNAL